VRILLSTCTLLSFWNLEFTGQKPGVLETGLFRWYDGVPSQDVITMEQSPMRDCPFWFKVRFSCYRSSILRNPYRSLHPNHRVNTPPGCLLDEVSIGGRDIVEPGNNRAPERWSARVDCLMRWRLLVVSHP
jgi:hypothetical protein